MKDQNEITTSELDNIARHGMKDAKAFFTDRGADKAKDKAILALKYIEAGTRRMSAENNRLSTALKVAKAVEAKAEEMAPLWAEVVRRKQSTAG